MNKSDIKQVLVVLQDYARWMYHNPEAIEKLQKQEISFRGHKLKLSIAPNGSVEITLGTTELIGKYQVFSVTAPLREGDGIENIEYKIGLVNADEIPKEFLEIFRDAGMFALSYFQRANAFSFLARMTPETIDSLTNDLSTSSLFEPRIL